MVDDDAGAACTHASEYCRQTAQHRPRPRRYAQGWRRCCNGFMVCRQYRAPAGCRPSRRLHRIVPAQPRCIQVGGQGWLVAGEPGIEHAACRAREFAGKQSDRADALHRELLGRPAMKMVAPIRARSPGQCCASKAPVMPLSTSPMPALAIPGCPLRLIHQRPSGEATMLPQP